MIERISEHILDLLQADARLFEGGNAYASGWSGVTREENGDTPAAGMVNLFDKSHDPDASGHRPAVYVGARDLEASDGLAFPTCSDGNRVEYRIAVIPLVLCVQAPTKREARQQRNQLRRNLKIILLGKIIETGYWAELTMPGSGGREKIWTTATGGGSQQLAEALGVVPVHVLYSFKQTSDA